MNNEELKTINISVYQGPIDEQESINNFKVVQKVFSEETRNGCDFLCFPEAFLTGYSPEAIKYNALTINDLLVQKLIKITKDSDTVLLVGMCEKTAKGTFNSQLVIHRGLLLGIAHKTILTRGFDDRFFITDRKFPVFEAHGIKFGVVICHSTSFIEPSLLLRLKGARLLFAPHYNDMAPTTLLPCGKTVTFAEHRDVILANQAAIAAILHVVVARANIVKITSEHIGSGDSNIWGIDGKLLAAGKLFETGVVSAAIDKKILTEEFWVKNEEIPISLYEKILAQVKKNRSQL